MVTELPGWENTPSWVNFMATDGNGDLHWFQDEPEFIEELQKWANNGRWELRLNLTSDMRGIARLTLARRYASPEAGTW